MPIHRKLFGVSLAHVPEVDEVTAAARKEAAAKITANRDAIIQVKNAAPLAFPRACRLEVVEEACWWQNKCFHSLKSSGPALKSRTPPNLLRPKS